MMIEDKEPIKILTKRTKTFLFVFPMLGNTVLDFFDPKTKLNRSMGSTDSDNLLNCFIADKDKPEYSSNIFILYKFNGSKEFSIFEDTMKNKDCFVDMYDPTPNHVMFVFDVPEQYKLEYSLFRSERPRIYRRFSNDYKKHIIKFLDPLPFDTESLADILYSREKRFKQEEERIGVSIPRDLDNYSIPIIEEETFNKNLYIN